MKMDLETKMEKQDAAVKKMAKYLREGARMLDLSCPECNNPIFQMKTGEKICVVCEKQVFFESEMAENETPDQGKPNDQNGVEPEVSITTSNPRVQNNDVFRSQSLIFFKLKQACVLKLASLTKKITRTDDENASSLILSNTVKVLEILEKLRFF